MTHEHSPSGGEACPFCASADGAFVERADFSSAYVMCNDCGARGPTSCDETEEDARASEAGECEPGERAAWRLWNTRAIPKPTGLEAAQDGEARRRPTQQMVDAALDAEWPSDGKGDLPCSGPDLSIREVMEGWLGGILSTACIERAMGVAIKAALNPPVGNEWAVQYDREGPR